MKPWLPNPSVYAIGATSEIQPDVVNALRRVNGWRGQLRDAISELNGRTEERFETSREALTVRREAENASPAQKL
jgi:hypothetical protein